MVLIIRNSRILSSRQSRIKSPLSHEQKDKQKLCHKEIVLEHNQNPSDMSTVRVLGTLFLYSVAMFTLPFAAFYGVQHWIQLEYKMDKFTNNCISVFAAVVTVNLIISCYAYQALHEPDEEPDNKAVVDQPWEDGPDKKDD